MPINILGMDIKKERFPNLHKIAEKDPGGLAARLKALIDGADAENAAIMLEHDLEHERLGGSKG